MSTNNSENEREVELLESEFSFHEFTDCISSRISSSLDYTCQITKLKNSFYVWIGKTDDEKMNDLTYAFPSSYDNLPVSTCIMGSFDHSTREDSSSLAMKLTSLTKCPVYVSCNVELNDGMLSMIQKRLINEFKNTPGIISPNPLQKEINNSTA